MADRLLLIAAFGVSLVYAAGGPSRLWNGASRRKRVNAKGRYGKGNNVPKAVQAFRMALRSKDVVTFREAALRLRTWQQAEDPHYPIYHFTSPENWNNDPTGLIYDARAGLYHRFYIFQPVDASGSTLAYVWGHTVSRDLATWEDWPVALWNDTPWDAGGAFSGNMVIDDEGVPTVMYTGNIAGHAKTYGVCARSFDGFVTWNKSLCMDDKLRPNPASPVNWDTSMWKDESQWYALIGGCTYPNQEGTAFLWQSPDLRNWTLIGDIWPGGPGHFWELPYLLPFDDSGFPSTHEDGVRYALLFGWGNTYWIGSFNKTSHQFTPSNMVNSSSAPFPETSDPGNYYSFNPSMTDHKGINGTLRRLMFGWVNGGWAQPYWSAQAHSLLREVTLATDGQHIIQQPATEVEALRTQHAYHIEHLQLHPGRNVTLPHGDALEVRAVFALPEWGLRNLSNLTFGILVRISPDGAEAERISFEALGRTVSAEGLSGPKKAAVANLTNTGQNVTLRVFLDRSICEVYCGGAVITSRLFPKEPLTSTGIAAFASGGTVHLIQLDVWRMGSMWGVVTERQREDVMYV